VEEGEVGEGTSDEEGRFLRRWSRWLLGLGTFFFFSFSSFSLAFFFFKIHRKSCQQPQHCEKNYHKEKKELKEFEKEGGNLWRRKKEKEGASVKSYIGPRSVFTLFLWPPSSLSDLTTPPFSFRESSPFWILPRCHGDVLAVPSHPASTSHSSHTPTTLTLFNFLYKTRW